MEEFWILILVAFFATNLLDKTESVKLELKTFDEIFGEGWWDNGEAEDLKMPPPTNFGQNVHHQIDRQNTQIGQIEPNSTDQLGQIEPNSTDQNPPLTGWKSELGHTRPTYSDDKKLKIKAVTNFPYNALADPTSGHFTKVNIRMFQMHSTKIESRPSHHHRNHAFGGKRQGID
uniref:Uncharacterized protein n=1 Tax=Globodera rostochiensis TaxID=31243 RepID=A0A914HNM8_GLORO